MMQPRRLPDDLDDCHGSTTTPTFTITTQPSRGVASISGTTLTYTPAANDFTTTAAPLTLVYQAAIGSNNDTGTITIAIASVNDAHGRRRRCRSVDHGHTPLTIAISSLLSNDSPALPTKARPLRWPQPRFHQQPTEPWLSAVET